jgi:hypothetical protein
MSAKTGVHYTTTVADLMSILAGMNLNDPVMDWEIRAWRCECHPWATWTYFNDYPGCPISDTNYASYSRNTYGTRYANLDALAAEHGDVTCEPALVENALTRQLFDAALARGGVNERVAKLPPEWNPA